MRFIQSYAKINLTLDILGRRADGYHEVITIMQTVDLCDTICLMRTEDATIRAVCTRPELSTADNLVVRAAQAMYERKTVRHGLLIELNKRIPVAAGLGGGSGNAAAVIQALDRWWSVPLLPSATLQEIAASLGSDIPFFLTGGLGYCDGRGERVIPLKHRLPASMRWILLVRPAIEISAGTVYRDLTARDYSDGSASRALQAALAEEQEHIPVEYLHNGLERSVLEHYPEVAQARDALLQAGASDARLSGSGPTLFTTCADLAQAAQIQQRLQSQGYEAYLTRPVYPE
jgi:4-diphosphocytidyl-2-C-methyl-D-erythritol kinase